MRVIVLDGSKTRGIKYAWLFTNSDRAVVCLDKARYVVHDVMCVVTTIMRTLYMLHEVHVHGVFVMYCLRLYETCRWAIATAHGSSTLLLSPFSLYPPIALSLSLSLALFLVKY